MSEPAHLEVAIRHRAGALALDVSFALAAPWTVLFAPSGAGKSTVLRIIAGLLEPDAGRVAVRGDVLADTTARIFVPPHRRRIPLVAQRAGVFPHLSVEKNVAYGARTQDVDALMAMCRIEALAGKMPGTLSGGEQQRVALARALAAAPGCRMLLLDEAFHGFDVALRDEVMRDGKTWLAQQAIPVLQVTHDVGEVFALGAEVLRMDGGRIVAQGEACQVLAGERARLMRQLEAR